MSISFQQQHQVTVNTKQKSKLPQNINKENSHLNNHENNRMREE